MSLLKTQWGIAPYLALPIVVPGMFALGYALQRGVINRAGRGKDENILLVTLGISIVLENLALLVFKSDTRSLETPYTLSTMAIGPAPVLPVLSVLPGPRFDHLARPAQLVGRWTVSPHSDRVGVRLDGGALDRTSPAEIESEGLVRGAVQAPPGGQLVVFGPDHPTTGGYPVIGVLTPDSLSVLAQARPGEQVRLEWR